MKNFPVIGDIIEIKNDTGTYKLLIKRVTSGKATGCRWDNKKGCWSKTSNFAIFASTKNWRILK